MPQPVDVGSVLGGRYKVTGHVLASADDDLVLDGVDQVLNRPVSILLASPLNASQMTASARELATGERPGNIQVLDLGISDEHTYLVTNKAEPADLLDLVIEQNQPYIEPFFTDTLGSEIFGQARSTEPMVYDDDEEYYHEQERKQRAPRKSKPQPQPRRQEPPRAAAAPPPPSSPPTVSSGDRHPQEHRQSSRFPAGALAGSAVYDGSDDGDPDYENYDDAPPAQRGRKVRRGVIGAVFALILVVAVVLAVSQLGNFDPQPVAGEDQTSTAPASSGEPTPSPTESATAQEQAPVTPEAVGVTRLVPDNPQLNSGSDGDLPRLIDNNPASYWQSFVFANDTFGGLAQNMALVVELQEPSSINQVEITQLNGSGGSFEVLLNDEPTLEGARQVGQSSFTGTTVTVPVPKEDGNAVKAQYVIVNFTQLPRLSGIQAEFPWGLRIAEINVS